MMCIQKHVQLLKHIIIIIIIIIAMEKMCYFVLYQNQYYRFYSIYIQDIWQALFNLAHFNSILRIQELYGRVIKEEFLTIFVYIPFLLSLHVVHEQ